MVLLKGKVYISINDQEREIDERHIQCLTEIIYGQTTTKQGTYCNRTWDGIACWPEADPGTEVSLPCPDYIHGFYVYGHAKRQCLSDGHWFVHPALNKTWTNYSQCYDEQPVPVTVSPYLQRHMDNIRIIFIIGYSLSLFSLLIAVFIMLYFRRLHCPRNTIHINLFVSFILRSALSLLKETIMVQGLGLRSDVWQDPNAHDVVFIENGTHWECKLLFCCLQYVLCASYMWLFVEGLHLHHLIMVSVFSERSTLKYYITFGWLTPLVHLIPWIIVRITKEDVLCWNTNPTPGYFWILKGPIMLTIVVNFGLFLNILRALLTKVKIPNSKAKVKYRYRRMAKAALVLIPLCGVHYIVFIGFQDHIDPATEVVKLYFEIFLGSFQGLLVAVLFCFMSNEVQLEILKRVFRKSAHRYRYYYRTSIGQGSTRCICECHKPEISESNATRQSLIEPHTPSSKKYSEDTKTTSTSHSRESKHSKQCTCHYHSDSNGTGSKYFSRTGHTWSCTSGKLRRTESCL